MMPVWTVIFHDGFRMEVHASCNTEARLYVGEDCITFAFIRTAACQSVL